MKHCEDCGGILERSGICGNCHEELHILTYQSEDIRWPVSKEFEEKAAEQNRSIK
jgi:hypothetical protein